MADKKTKNKTGMDLGRVLLWAAVIVSAPRWAGAMLAADMNHIADGLSAFLNLANTVSGLGMGVLEVIATAYLLDALRQAKPTYTVTRKGIAVERRNWRFYGIAFFVVGLLAMTPLVLAPYLVSRMAGEDVAAVLATRVWQYVWATTVVVVPVFVVGGVAFSQAGLVTVGSHANPQQVAEAAGELSASRNKLAASKAGPQESRMQVRSWKSLPASEKLKVARMSASEVARTYDVPERTAYDWIKYARRDHGVVGEVAKFQDEVSNVR
jgi:hypothetical protein